MKKSVLFIFLLITFFSVLAHFWNYNDLVGFTLDSPIHLTGAREMVDSGKISLIGPSITSKEVMGRVFFLGPFYYYVLALLGIISNWNVIFISGFFTSLWISTFIILFLWLNKKFGNKIAILIYTLLSFYPFFIQISRAIWNLQFIPLFGTLFLICLVERKKLIHYLLAGIFWGLGLNVHYMTALWIFIAGFFLISEIYYKRFNIKYWLALVLGVVLAELPLIVFEFRHNFYNLNTLLFQIKYGGLSQGYTFAIWYYYILPFLPLAAFLAGKLFNYIKRTRFDFILTSFLTVISICFMILAFGSSGQKAMHYPGWSIKTQKEVVNIIDKGNEGKFEVAETISSDTRATDVRWWLREVGVDVMKVEEYDKAPVLYLVTTPDRPPESETVWEVSSIRPFKVLLKVELGEGLLLYKLAKL
jgi:hypothetical protein